MSLDSSPLRDEAVATAGYSRPTEDASFVRGHGVVEVHGPDGELKSSTPFTNLITQVGEQMYGERGAGISGAVATPTAMHLGTGTTTAAKTGAGSAIVTFVPNSSVAINTPSSALSPTNTRRITYVGTWAAGTATATGIAEVAVVNQAAGTQAAAPSANTISRALLSPTVNKGPADTLTITWNHDIGT
jgi:hypothetical protein